MTNFKKVLEYGALVVFIIFLLWLGKTTIAIALTSSSTVSVMSVQSYVVRDFINMTEDDFNRIKETEIRKMIIDTAKAYNINPTIFVGLSWHESSRFQYANKKIKDSNGRWSYGLFMIQLETAKDYDKSVTEEKLLNPIYNTHLAAIIYQKNFNKYGSNEYAIAAHNAGIIYNRKITNSNFVKLVYASIGEVVAKYNM